MKIPKKVYKNKIGHLRWRLFQEIKNRHFYQLALSISILVNIVLMVFVLSIKSAEYRDTSAFQNDTVQNIGLSTKNSVRNSVNGFGEWLFHNLNFLKSKTQKNNTKLNPQSKNNKKNWVKKNNLNYSEYNLKKKLGINSSYLKNTDQKNLIQKKNYLTKNLIFKDPNNLINDDFSIPNEINQRVGFWFDIYSKYSQDQHIVHHREYPWIIFDIINVSHLSNENQKKSYIQKRYKKVKSEIRKLSKLRSFTNISKGQAYILNQLSKHPTNNKTLLKRLSKKIRIQSGRLESFKKGLTISSSYLPEMENIFSKKGLPSELTRLPLVESGFDINATSKVGAKGIWQIMPFLGKRFLALTLDHDERISPFKSTELAANILKENHMILWRKWPLALSAYNHGPTEVRKAIKKLKTKNISKIINNYRSKRYNFASANFYPCFLAALYIEKYKDSIFNYIPTRKAIKGNFIKPSTSLSFSELSKTFGFSSKKLVKHNPDLYYFYKNRKLIPSGIRVFIPQNSLYLAKHP